MHTIEATQSFQRLSVDGGGGSKNGKVVSKKAGISMMAKKEEIFFRRSIKIRRRTFEEAKKMKTKKPEKLSVRFSYVTNKLKTPKTSQ